MKIVNMAQGAFLIMSAYLCYSLWAHLGIDPLLGSLIAAVPMGLIGAGIYRFVVERVQRTDHGLTIVVTFALAIVSEALIALAWGPNPTATTRLLQPGVQDRLGDRPEGAAVRLPPRGRRHRRAPAGP